MSDDSVRRANLAAVPCEPRPQLPDGFRRSSASPARVALFSSITPVGAVDVAAPWASGQA